MSEANGFEAGGQRRVYWVKSLTGRRVVILSIFFPAAVRLGDRVQQQGCHAGAPVQHHLQGSDPHPGGDVQDLPPLHRAQECRGQSSSSAQRHILQSHT